MNKKSRSISLITGKEVIIRGASGRFIISHSHESDYINLPDIKLQHNTPKKKAVRLSGKYKTANIKRYT